METNAKTSVFAEYALKRENAFAAARRREAEIEAKIPETARLNREIAAIVPELLRLGTEGAEDYKEKSDALYRKHEKLIVKKQGVLKANGYPPDYDCPVFDCKLCNDAGYVGANPCFCLKETLARRAYYSSGLGKALDGQTFKTMDMAYYTGTTDSGASVKEQMRYVYDYCKSYAESFTEKAESLLLIGGAGLGKTHLASAIGRAVIDKGFSVVYESAQNVINSFENERFGRDGGADTARYTDCRLLIIDDLGTEFNTQYTVSVLFNLLNHRIINEKPTIVTTNLSLKEIESLYKERIYSRLRGDYTTLGFCGKDIRRLKKERQN